MNLFFRKSLKLLSLQKVPAQQENITCLSIKLLPSMSFINNIIFNGHPSIVEAEKIFKSLEKDYEKKMTEICLLGEERLQSFKKEKIKKILSIENSIQVNLTIAQDIAAKPREIAEQNLAKIEFKNYSNPLKNIFNTYQKKIAKYQLKKAKAWESRIIDSAFEKHHILRDQSKLKMKEEEEKFGQQILQEVEIHRAKELSRLKQFRNKINFLVEVLQNSPEIDAISIL